MSLPRKFNTWRKHWGVWKRLVHSWLPRLSRNLGAATGAVTLWWQAYLPISARTVITILPVLPTFPTRCGTDGFFHFSIHCSNRLGWYWGRQRTSWIRKTVTVFRRRKNFVYEIFAVTDNRENFLTAKISRYTVLIANGIKVLKLCHLQKSWFMVLQCLGIMLFDTRLYIRTCTYIMSCGAHSYLHHESTEPESSQTAKIGFLLLLILTVWDSRLSLW